MDFVAVPRTGLLPAGVPVVEAGPTTVTVPLRGDEDVLVRSTVAVPLAFLDPPTTEPGTAAVTCDTTKPGAAVGPCVGVGIGVGVGVEVGVGVGAGVGVGVGVGIGV